MVPVTVIRHPRERISKCSLRPLHGHAEITFLKANPGFTFDATGFTVLRVDAPELTPDDSDRPLLLLDSTWKLLPKLESCVTGNPTPRSLPGGIDTAYPRISKLFEDPLQGLASVEALYLAQRILGHDEPALLDGYHWAKTFMATANTRLEA